MGGEKTRVNAPHISSNCSLGDNLSPEPRQSVTLEIVWRNPDKKRGKRKFWPDLRIVGPQPKRAA